MAKKLNKEYGPKAQYVFALINSRTSDENSTGEILGLEGDLVEETEHSVRFDHGILRTLNGREIKRFGSFTLNKDYIIGIGK